jgi:hypothetical protein
MLTEEDADINAAATYDPGIAQAMKLVWQIAESMLGKIRVRLRSSSV